jgi:hypothetical protein
MSTIGHLRGGQNWVIFGPRGFWSLRSITKAVKYHGKLTNSVLPPHNMTPILRTSGQMFMISSVLNKAAATDAPAEASITSFILSATIFIPLSISSLLIVNTDSSINSHNIGKVS